ncbi:MAG TPA: SDR family oxidoreductase [Candidatus Limnocylindria bacterium]|nr:SDR family oxidoreductase [Candidatus Limnocylindria bacterium]
MELDGKAILVTGGAGGLGAETAAVLRSAGARVVIHDREAERGAVVAAAINASGAFPPVRFVAGDLGDLPTARATVLALDAEVGGFYGLVNNAAVIPLRPIADYTIAEYEEIQRVNAHAAFVLTQALAPSMAARGGGAVVNLCSITLGGEWANFVPYVASKGALLGMTRALARELGPAGIRVNAVSPGAIPTDAERVHPNPEGYARWVLERQSLKFRGTPRDVAEAVLFLLSDRSRFISGQNLNVNGGWLMA